MVIQIESVVNADNLVKDGFIEWKAVQASTCQAIKLYPAQLLQNFFDPIVTVKFVHNLADSFYF